MVKRSALIFVAALAVAAMGYAQQPSTVRLPIGKTPANDGKQMFVNYCAPCHGVDGRGTGPVTSSLVQKPIDLTLMQKNNGGKFPSAHLVSVLQFGSEMPSAHGTKDMPVWGPILGSMDHTGINSDTQALRIKNVETYIRSLQVN